MKIFSSLRGLVFGLVLASTMGILLGMAAGSTGLESLRTAGHDAMAWQIVWEIRLPRTLGALAAGALLGLAGAIGQGLFRNPLADPYLLGTASGASLGVASALVLFGVSPWTSELRVHLGMTGAAFVGAVLAVLLTLLLARGVGQTLRLLLAGVVVGVVMGAMTSFITLLHPDVLAGMQGFNLGSTAFISWTSCLWMSLVAIVCIGLAWRMGFALDALTLGESTAISLGVDLRLVRIVFVLVMALATGTAVAQTGLVAFVGLVAPHLVRSSVPVKHAALLWLSAWMGGVLLLLADVLARILFAPQEMPVGVWTAVLGGGYLLWMMYRSPSTRGVS